jgi:hypothetical protein
MQAMSEEAERQLGVLAAARVRFQETQVLRRRRYIYSASDIYSIEPPYIAIYAGLRDAGAAAALYISYIKVYGGER